MKELQTNTKITCSTVPCDYQMILSKTRPCIVLKQGKKTVKEILLDDILEEALSEESMSQKSLKMYKNKFDQLSKLLNDFIMHEEDVD